MNEIQVWFEEAIEVSKVFNVLNANFIIYKGFKITEQDNGEYRLEDTRFSNLYTPVTKRCYNTFVRLGFIKGVDTISHARDTKRVETYRKRTGILYDKRRRWKNELPMNKKLNHKRIRNINKRVGEYVDLIFYYQTRVEQFNFKYNN